MWPSGPRPPLDQSWGARVDRTAGEIEGRSNLSPVPVSRASGAREAASEAARPRAAAVNAIKGLLIVSPETFFTRGSRGSRTRKDMDDNDLENWQLIMRAGPNDSLLEIRIKGPHAWRSKTIRRTIRQLELLLSIVEEDEESGFVKPEKSSST